MITLTRPKSNAKAIWIELLSMKPPINPAVIFASRCHLDVVRYFGLAGIV